MNPLSSGNAWRRRTSVASPAGAGSACDARGEPHQRRGGGLLGHGDPRPVAARERPGGDHDGDGEDRRGERVEPGLAARPEVRRATPRRRAGGPTRGTARAPAAVTNPRTRARRARAAPARRHAPARLAPRVREQRRPRARRRRLVERRLRAPLGQPLELVHRLSSRWARSCVRARWMRERTVPTGTPVAAAISV